MRADLLTKAFTDSARWEAACWLLNVLHPDRLQEVIELGDRPPPQLGGGTKKGVWYPNADGSGCWSRTDYSCERYRDLYACGPKRAEVTRRVTTNLATGEILEDTDEFSISRNRCAPIRPDPKDPTKPGGEKFSLRTDFYYDSTAAVVAASPEADVGVDQDECPEVRSPANREPVATAEAGGSENCHGTDSVRSRRAGGRRTMTPSFEAEGRMDERRIGKWPRCESSMEPAPQKRLLLGTPNQEGQKHDLPHHTRPAFVHESVGTPVGVACGPHWRGFSSSFVPIVMCLRP